MRRALCLLPEGPNYCRAAFLSGLNAVGFEVESCIDKPAAGDLLLLWNRPARLEREAKRFEAAGGTVLVVENGYLGKNWRGQKWFAIALGHHAGAGKWSHHGPSRWDSWDIDLAPWRAGGNETVIFAQRGIGEPGIASPRGWAQLVQARSGGRIRQHPGANKPQIPLADDLQNASAAVTWHSAAALSALVMGVPVWYAFDQWIGAAAARPISEFGAEPMRDDARRLAMFQRLAWAMWNVDEVSGGEALNRLLN